jgi:site-specific DNA-methyltransferase (adenine-specific)
VDTGPGAVRLAEGLCGLVVDMIDQIICGDCLEEMKKLPDNSINLIYTDPPYFKVKGEAWDNQWENPAKFIEWIGELCQEWRRILKPNGSLYVFASPKMAAGVECKIGEYFNVLNNIRWVKDAGWHNKSVKEELRSYLSPWEACIFAEKFGANSISPLGDSIKSARLSVGLKGTDIDIALGYVRTKDPKRGTEMCRRWEEGSSVPSKDDFIKAMQICNRNPSYEDLKREYEDLRRPFSVTSEIPYTDVWDFPTVAYYEGKHPCEKPIEMHRHVIAASSRPGDLVLDCFGGSCKVADACIQLNRRYIIIEQDAEYARKARKRVLSINPENARKRIAAIPARLDRWAEAGP